SASSTGSAARKVGRRSQTKRVRRRARGRVPASSPSETRGITSSLSRIRPKAPPLANGFRFRTECARERPCAPANNGSFGARRRVGGPTPSTDEPRGVVQAEAGHLHDRVRAAEDLGASGAKKTRHAEILHR